MEGPDSAEDEFDIFMDDTSLEMDLNLSQDDTDLWDDLETESSVEPTSMMSTESDGELQPSDDRSAGAIKQVEDMVLSFLTQLATSGDKINNAESEIGSHAQMKRCKSKPKIQMRLIDRMKQTADGKAKHKCITFPRKSVQGSAKPFAQLFKVLNITHESLLYKSPCTKRDIYYKDVTLFKSQRVVDRLVDDLAATFEMQRSDLNIRATSKGLICGSGLTINLETGETIQANDTEGTPIPVGEDIHSFSIEDNVTWVLIVEKDAVFQSLCRYKIVDHEAMPGRGLLITGKGYPDIATRHLVKSLSDALPRSIPIMALVDADPYGLDILSVYKYGSKSLQHESDKLAARRIKLLGLLTSELGSFGINIDSLLPFNKHDEKKAYAMLRRSPETLPGKWKKQLTYMLYTRRKAEIEILSTIRPHSPSNDLCFVHNGSMSPTSAYDHQDVLCYSDPSSNGPTFCCTTPLPMSVHTSRSVAPIHLPQFISPLVRYLCEKITLNVQPTWEAP